MIHCVNDGVKRYFVRWSKERGKLHGVERAHRRDGVPFYAWDLDKPVYRVAGETQRMLHGNFGGIFDLFEIESV